MKKLSFIAILFLAVRAFALLGNLNPVGGTLSSGQLQFSTGLPTGVTLDTDTNYTLTGSFDTYGNFIAQAVAVPDYFENVQNLLTKSNNFSNAANNFSGTFYYPDGSPIGGTDGSGNSLLFFPNGAGNLVYPVNALADNQGDVFCPQNLYVGNGNLSISGQNAFINFQTSFGGLQWPDCYIQQVGKTFKLLAGTLTGTVTNVVIGSFNTNARVSLMNPIYGSGSGLTNLNASALASGTVPDSAISSTWASKSDATNAAKSVLTLTNPGTFSTLIVNSNVTFFGKLNHTLTDGSRNPAGLIYGEDYWMFNNQFSMGSSALFGTVFSAVFLAGTNIDISQNAGARNPPPTMFYGKTNRVLALTFWSTNAETKKFDSIWYDNTNSPNGTAVSDTAYNFGPVTTITTAAGTNLYRIFFTNSLDVSAGPINATNFSCSRFLIRASSAPGNPSPIFVIGLELYTY